MMKVCQALVGQGHEVRVWLPGRSPDMDWSELAEHYGLRETFKIRWLRSLAFLRRYDFCMRAVLAAWFWGADLYYVWPLQAAAVASTLRLPTVLEMHDIPQGRFGPWLFRLFLRGAGAKRLLPTTEALRAYLAKQYRVRLEPPAAIVSPNGVDLDRYAELPSAEFARAELELPNTLTVGYTGHLYPGRGVELLFELARMNPSIQFIWAGGEPAAIERWRRRLRDANLDNVILQGFISNDRLPLVQAACDILMMPYARRISVSSGGDTARFANPMKVFEYLACGRAIVSSDLPILREILNEGNALLVQPEDVTAWDQALKTLSQDSSLREKLADQARMDGMRYSWQERAQRALSGLEV